MTDLVRRLLDRRRAAHHAQLGADVRDVPVHGVLAKHETSGDLGVAQAGHTGVRISGTSTWQRGEAQQSSGVISVRRGTVDSSVRPLRAGAREE